MNIQVNQKNALVLYGMFVGTLGFRVLKSMSPQAHDEIILFTSSCHMQIADMSLINSDNEKEINW